MKTGDKIATAFFWLAATFLTCVLIYMGFLEHLHEPPPWLIIADALGLAMLLLGLRQCWLSLCKSKLTGKLNE